MHPSNKQLCTCKLGMKLSSGLTPCYFLIAGILFLLKSRKGHWNDLILAYIWTFTMTFQEVFVENVRAQKYSLQLFLISNGVILRNYVYEGGLRWQPR